MRSAPTHAGFWVFVAHAYGCTLAMAWIYAKAIWSSPIHRQQGILLLTSTPLPALTNAIIEPKAISTVLVWNERQPRNRPSKPRQANA